MKLSYINSVHIAEPHRRGRSNVACDSWLPDSVIRFFSQISPWPNFTKGESCWILIRRPVLQKLLQVASGSIVTISRKLYNPNDRLPK